jgi:selT/selW/selH-like putative selenoprotein
VGLAAEVNGLDGHTADATPGGKGQFDVLVDDVIVFSKQAEGRFPDHDEILSRL